MIQHWLNPSDYIYKHMLPEDICLNGVERKVSSKKQFNNKEKNKNK